MACPRDDAFYFDSAAVFDTLNFRKPAPVLTGGADQGQGPAAPAAIDGFAGYNISLIAVEAPISMLTANKENCRYARRDGSFSRPRLRPDAGHQSGPGCTRGDGEDCKQEWILVTSRPTAGLTRSSTAAGEAHEHEHQRDR